MSLMTVVRTELLLSTNRATLVTLSDIAISILIAMTDSVTES